VTSQAPTPALKRTSAIRRTAVSLLLLVGFASTPSLLDAAALPPAAPTKDVSPLPSDSIGGRTISLRGGGDLQATLNSAREGDTLVLQAGATWTGNFELPARANKGWITLRGSMESKLPSSGVRVSPAHAAAMPKILTPNASPALSAKDGTHGWRLVGLEIGVVPAWGATTYQLVSLGWGTGEWGQRRPSDVVASRFAIERCYIHGSQGQRVRRGILANVADVRIADSWIDEIHDSGFDSQAVLGYDSPGPYLIVNNMLQASSENIMFGGSDLSGPGFLPSDIVIRGNHILKPARWNPGDPAHDGRGWVIKPSIELKFGQRIVIEENLLENSWLWPAFVADAFGPSGVVVQDVMFRNNRIVRSVCSWQIWSAQAPVRRIAILNNASDEALDPGHGNAYARGAVGNLLSSRALPIEDLWIEHNTVAKGLRGITISAASYLPRLTIRNNAFPYGPWIEGAWIWKDLGNADPYWAIRAMAPDRAISSNAIFGPPHAIRWAYDQEEFRVWPSAAAAGIGPNGGLLDGSPLRRAGSDGADIGVDWRSLRDSTTPTPRR
jgi:hypothetical protein